MDETPLIYKPEKHVTDGNPWIVDNQCRVAYQVLVGIESLKLMVLVEAIVARKVNWIPLSLHHDGFAFLWEKQTVEQAKI
jgi:hypothetical protein